MTNFNKNVMYVCAYKREGNVERDIIKGLQIRFITNLLIYFSLATKLEEF